MPPPFCEAQSRAEPRASAAHHETRAVGWTLIAILGIAGGLYPLGEGIYELARPAGECVERDAGGACIQTQTPSADQRMIAGLSAGLGLVELVVGIVFALLADDEFHQAAQARQASSVSMTPWLWSDGRGGAAGMVLRW